jgi:hypothetical protein
MEDNLNIIKGSRVRLKPEHGTGSNVFVWDYGIVTRVYRDNSTPEACITTDKGDKIIEYIEWLEPIEVKYMNFDTHLIPFFMNNVVLSKDYHNYRESWDWIMPVVNKIKGLYNDWEYSEDKDRWNAVDLSIQTGEVFKVYLAVVEFIKWYDPVMYYRLLGIKKVA